MKLKPLPLSNPYPQGTADWQVPFGRGRAYGANVNRLVDGIIGGWEVSGFFTLQSGFPIQVSQSGGTPC